MEPKKPVSYTWLPKMYSIFSRGDFKWQRVLVSQMTESLYEWRRVDIHAIPPIQTRYMATSNILDPPFSENLDPPLNQERLEV